MSSLLPVGTVPASNPYKLGSDALVSIRLLNPGVLDVIHHMCKVEFFQEAVSLLSRHWR